MKKIFFKLIFIVLITMPGMSMAIEDPTGDFIFPDITNLDAKKINENIEIIITCKDAVTGEGSSTVSGTVFLDTDQNYSTGDNGFDYTYNFNIINIIYAEPVITTSLNYDAIANSLSLNNNKIFITIPLSALKKKDGNINLVATIHGQMAGAIEFDRSPDSGVLNVATGAVEVPFPGISSATGNIKDSSKQKSSSVDITDINTIIKDGNLYLLVTYDKSIGPEKVSYGEDILGKVYIDIDQKLSTGFKNIGEVPPTFGIDYILDYSIGTLSGTSANIQKAENNADFQKTINTPIGPPYNDASFKIKDNQILITIPLGLLGYDDGNMDIAVESTTIQGLLNADFDLVPDIEKGALITKDGTIRPLLSCTEPKITINDIPGDSFGKGYDGDDFTGIDACYSNKTLLLTISYTSYSLDDASITTIYFDTNNDKDIIPDYIFMYQIYNGVLKSFFSSRTNVVPIEYTQLISMKGDKIYISIPLELMDNDDGNMNIYSESALIVARAGIPITDYGREWIGGVDENDFKIGIGEVHINPDKSSRTVYDRMPDVGYVEIKKGITATTEYQKDETILKGNTPKGETQETISPIKDSEDINSKKNPGFESIIVIIILIILIIKIKNGWQSKSLGLLRIPYA